MFMGMYERYIERLFTDSGSYMHDTQALTGASANHRALYRYQTSQMYIT